MQARAIELDETPINLGRGVVLEQVVSARETGGELVYLHVYDQDDEPTDDDEPSLSLAIPANEVRPFGVFYSASANLWLAASTDHLAGLTAPSSALELSITCR